MNITKNKLLQIIVLLWLFAYQAQSTIISNSTDNLSLKVDDISLNLLTLTFLAHNFSILEKAPVRRQVLNVEKIKISLELARTILLMRFQLDCFYMENIFISILEDDDGNIFLFNKNIKQKEIDELFGTETNKQAKSETKIDLSIPKMEIKNLNITCLDHNRKTFLWSINNLNLYIYDFLSPPNKNKDIWSIFISANFNNKTNSSFRFSAKCRTIPDNTFLKLNIAASDIDWKTLDMIVNSGKNTGSNPKVKHAAKKHTNFQGEDSSPFTIIFNSFSNEINRISDAFSQKISNAKTNHNVTNFFNNTNISNLVFSFNWDMTVSNHVFKEGNINLKMYDEKTNSPPLIYKYQITNSKNLLVE
ncbi:MAG: hypothetical protein DRI44_02830 [Chlamydiae bacterium]|nr:MAG: hypothetical protein DRI44_02830 [Chlamydiota bacterium]